MDSEGEYGPDGLRAMHTVACIDIVYFQIPRLEDILREKHIGRVANGVVVKSKSMGAGRKNRDSRGIENFDYCELISF